MKQQHYKFQHHSIHQKTPIKVSHMNLYHCNKPVYHFLNKHNYPKLLYIYHGACNLQIDDSTHSLMANDILLINQGNFEMNIEPDTSSVNFVMIGFEEIEFIFPSGNANLAYQKFTIVDKENLSFLNTIVKELSSENIFYQQSCTHYINLLFIHLYRSFNLKTKTIMKEKISKDCDFIRAYLDEHFTEDITLDTLAEISKMNKYYLVHSFTNTYGCSPINYLNEKKIDESKNLLQNTNYSIAEIAKIIGFSSQSYFSQSFKKHTYMTPNEYRRSTRH